MKKNPKLTVVWAVGLFSFLVVFTRLDAADSVYTSGAQMPPDGAKNRGLTTGVIGPLNFGSRAEGGTVQVRANQEFTYDDNLYLTQFGKTNDWISITSPGIYYRIGDFKNNAVEIGYDVNIARFFQQSVENGEEHLPYLRAGFTIGKSKVSFSDQLAFIDGGTQRGSANEVTTRVKQTRNDANISSETQFNDKFALGLKLHHFYYNPQSNLLERNQVDGGLAVYYKAFAKADLYIEGDGGHVDVRNAAKEDFAQGKFGFRGELTPKLAGKIDFGMEYRTSSVASVGNLTTPILGGDLTYTFTPEIVANIRASRYVNVSIQTPGQKYTTSSAGANLSYQFGPVLDLDSKSRKFVAALDYSYENDDFDLPDGSLKRNVDIHTISPSIEYRIQKYWKIYVVYRYQDLSSSIPSSNYQDQRISFGTSFLF